MGACCRAGGSPAETRCAERPSPNPSRKREGRSGPLTVEAALRDTAALASSSACGRPRFQSFDCRRLDPLPRLREAGRGPAGAPVAAWQRPVAPRGPPPAPPASGRGEKGRPSCRTGGKQRGGPPAAKAALGDAAAFASSFACGRPRFRSFEIAGGSILLPRLRGRPGGGEAARAFQPGGCLAARTAASRRSCRSSQDANAGVVSLPT